MCIEKEMYKRCGGAAATGTCTCSRSAAAAAPEGELPPMPECAPDLN